MQECKIKIIQQALRILEHKGIRLADGRYGW